MRSKQWDTERASLPLCDLRGDESGFPGRIASRLCGLSRSKTSIRCYALTALCGTEQSGLLVKQAYLGIRDVESRLVRPLRLLSTDSTGHSGKRNYV